jgi:hypothetical protein
MNEFTIFGLSVALSFLAWTFVCYNYVWARLQTLAPSEAVRPLLVLHLFRFVGASFLVSGVTGSNLPRAFAAPGAYGDLIAVCLAWAAIALGRGPLALTALWIFNLWGTGDLLLAFYQGLFDPDFHPSSLGATFYIPTVYVPLLMCTHVMIFVILLRRSTAKLAKRG